MRKCVTVTHFTTKIIRTYLYTICNMKILFVKKYFSLLWVFTIFSILLYVFCHNINTAITRQLIRTVRTLEAKWWQVCGEVWVQGQRKMSQVLGTFGLLDFTMLRPILAWRVFLNLWTVYFFNFPNFFPGRSQPWINETADTESTDTAVHLHNPFLWVFFVRAIGYVSASCLKFK